MIVIYSHWEPSLPNAPGNDKIWEEASPEAKKERELARMTTMVIAEGRREGRQANDWRTFNEKTISVRTYVRTRLQIVRVG